MSKKKHPLTGINYKKAIKKDINRANESYNNYCDAKGTGDIAYRVNEFMRNVKYNIGAEILMSEHRIVDAILKARFPVDELTDEEKATK